MITLKKIIYACLDIIIGACVALACAAFLQEQIAPSQASTKTIQEKTTSQSLNHALSLLEGNGEVIKSSQIAYPSVGESYALIHNDARNFYKDLYFGDSTWILDISIGQFKDSGIPGQGRPILLAGHNGTHFKELKDFEIGDYVQIETSYGKYVYEVNKTEILAATDFEKIAWDVLAQEEEILIMYTCYPFDIVTTPDRYFVYAEKVKGPVIEEDGSWKE